MPLKDEVARKAATSAQGEVATLLAKVPAEASAANQLADKAYVNAAAAGAFTSAERNKLNGIAAGAQVNVIETIRVNGSALTPSSKAVDIKVPTKLGELTDDLRVMTYSSCRVLTLQEGRFSGTMDFDASVSNKTVNIPTKTSHLTNDSGFLDYDNFTDLNDEIIELKGTVRDCEQDLFDIKNKINAIDNTVKLTGEQTITGKKHFTDWLYAENGIALTENKSLSVYVDGQMKSLLKHHIDPNSGWKAVLFAEGLREYTFNFYGSAVAFYDGPNDKTLFRIAPWGINACKDLSPDENAGNINLGLSSRPWWNIYATYLNLKDSVIHSDGSVLHIYPSGEQVIIHGNVKIEGEITYNR